MEQRRLGGWVKGGGASDGIREGLNKNQENEMKLFFNNWLEWLHE